MCHILDSKEIGHNIEMVGMRDAILCHLPMLQAHLALSVRTQAVVNKLGGYPPRLSLNSREIR